jgi:hypothetical protein
VSLTFDFLFHTNNAPPVCGYSAVPSPHVPRRSWCHGPAASQAQCCATTTAAVYVSVDAILVFSDAEIPAVAMDSELLVNEDDDANQSTVDDMQTNHDDFSLQIIDQCITLSPVRLASRTGQS